MQNRASDRACQKQIAQTLREYDLAHSEAGQLLLSLSPETKIEILEVLEDEISLEADGFSGPVVWHVTLTFPEPGSPPFVSSETLPGVFRGRFENGAPVIVSLDVELGSLSETQSATQADSAP